jgi:SAM-dependent methyltransferase
MFNLFGNLSASSALKRFSTLVSNFGLMKTLTVTIAMVDDYHFRSFDRKYGVRTSGHIELSSTSFDKSKLRHATAYGPVNGWGFRRFLTELNLPKSAKFADLGCGLGRACFIAAEYGFAKVTGVELAPELCAVARENIASCHLRASQRQRIVVVEGDALDYCEHTEDDVFFMYRAFSLEFLQAVCKKLIQGAAQQKKPLTIIYTERLGWPPSECVTMLSNNNTLRKVYEYYSFGQAFYVYRCGE